MHVKRCGLDNPRLSLNSTARKSESDILVLSMFVLSGLDVAKAPEPAIISQWFNTTESDVHVLT
jgi:hypothetical protein